MASKMGNADQGPLIVSLKCPEEKIKQKTKKKTEQSRADLLWGISSNGRAPASHAGGTGIDTRILQ